MWTNKSIALNAKQAAQGKGNPRDKLIEARWAPKTAPAQEFCSVALLCNTLP
jgi:hypothetical protein